MPLIKIGPRDILETRATETFRQIARYDACDLHGEFEPERFYHLAELSAIRKGVEALGLDWEEFYALVADQVEIYESGREEQCHDGE